MKKIGYLLVIMDLIVLSACNAGSDATSSGQSDLSLATQNDILNAIANKDLSENVDAGGGYMTYDITLKINENGSFTYKMEENTAETVDFIEATGTMTFVGGVEKVNIPATESYQYEQKLMFKGTTDEGMNFELKGKIIQFVYEEGGMQDEWNISYDSYAISDQEKTSLTNYRLPFDDFTP